MAQTVNLDEKIHAVGVLHGLKQMRNEKDLCDFIIIVQGVDFHTHKVMLSLSSPYFRAMLKHDMKENQDGKVEIMDVDCECVKNCIEFMYTGSFDIPDGKMQDLLHVATLFQLDKVKQAIGNILKKALTVENYYSTREIAEVYDLKSVLSKCGSFYTQNFIVMSLRPEFQSEPKSRLINVLKAKNKKVTAEEKMEASLRWIGEDLEKREHFFELVGLINLEQLSSEFLKNLLEKNYLVSIDFQIYKLINAQFMEILTKERMKETREKEKRIVLFDRNSNRLQSYDPTAGQVDRFHNSTFDLPGNFSATTLDLHIYVLCPDKSTYRLDYGCENSEWERMPDMISSHGCYPPVVVCSGSLFVIGAGTGSPSKEVETFNPATKEWTKQKSRPKVIAGASIVAMDQSIYCIGGWTKKDSNQSTSFCKYTPSSSEWANLQPLRYARSYATCVATGQKMFVIGGFKGPSLIDTVECYDVAVSQWTSLAAMPVQYNGAMAHAVNGMIYLLGRYQTTDEILRYDTKSGKWCAVKVQGADELEISDAVLVQM